MRFFRIVVVLFLPALLSSETGSWIGWISDAKCGAKMKGYCAKSCIDAGERPVFVTDDKQIIAITNPELTKGYEGERVAVKGSVDDGKLTISSIDRAPSR